MYQRSGSKVTEVSASQGVFVSQPDTVARVIEAIATLSVVQRLNGLCDSNWIESATILRLPP